MDWTPNASAVFSAPHTLMASIQCLTITFPLIHGQSSADDGFGATRSSNAAAVCVALGCAGFSAACSYRKLHSGVVEATNRDDDDEWGTPNEAVRRAE